MAKFSWTHRTKEGVQFSNSDSTIEVIVDEILGFDGFRDAKVIVAGVPGVEEINMACNTHYNLTDCISLRILPRKLLKGRVIRMEYDVPDEYEVHEYSVKNKV